MNEYKTSGKIFAVPIREEIAIRWSNILKNGLEEAEKSNLSSKYPVPENCTQLEAPKLNLEVQAVVTETASRRDIRLMQVQNQIGTSLAALGKALSLILEEEGRGRRHLSMIQSLSDAGRLLSDVYFIQSSSRRDLVSLNLNKELKETMNKVNLDGWLFGENLEERVKATMNIERCGQVLKPQKPKQSVPRKPLVTLNSKSLPRYHQEVRRSRPKQQPRTSYQQQRSQHLLRYRQQRSQRSEHTDRFQRPYQASKPENRRRIV
ncbi:hypothetical protein NQ314_017592 [Rhamnusium bicolor]|uniref:Uncharacterized protein n=1 Tax=Rhamnusium bicolor TaxID=1586634 RepID=A0AAV8WT66_9CUCU|nr:hypothetical protein NQ314_017592 [Rhamnusium bicolor]